ncbi:MAG: succinate dehydrogenase assembly factor 2 [Ponticaulis sp.]|nr:succinate dehydrogenase assembly factor 2 [Ponticaulis sp.]
MDQYRRKLLFRAWRRGFRELDLIIGSFAEAHLPELSDENLKEFERLLDVPDWDMYAWLTGGVAVPENYSGPVMDLLLGFKYSPQPG